MVNYYRIHDYPFVAALNPRTGEKVAHFKNKYDTYSFCEAVTTFLSDRELPMVHDDTLEENVDDADSAVVIVDDDKKVNGLNGHSQVSPSCLLTRAVAVSLTSSWRPGSTGER